ncbi:MAG: hypothetical protein K2W81_15105 [Sphingomonas sp.]|uniref:hypothetical protein n=1 Tax=Sphingomonas sp. TaxID=28214 RepID=UPI0025EAFCF7|nr:hypothetical protein [Sphingomonas sp.]MBY0285276.1 hypothetical protein [Sphingomonas sp.]
MTDEINKAADDAAAAVHDAAVETGALVTTAAEETTDATQEAGTSFKDGATNFAKQAADKARDLASDGKARAGDALDEVSRLMGTAADTVDQKLGENYGQYARSAADGIASFSESLKAKEIDDLVADVQGFVRKSPAVAIGIAAALGFVVARLVKAGMDGGEAKADEAKSGPDDSVDA